MMKAILALLLVIGMVVSKDLKEVNNVLQQLKDAGVDVNFDEAEETDELHGADKTDETEEPDEKPDQVLPEDNTSHDCKNVHRIPVDRGDGPDRDNLPEYLARVYTSRKTGIPKEYVKWNHAYGFPVLGVEEFSTEAMQKACYLIRFLMADNEWLRRYAYQKKMLARGQKSKEGGTCCPAKITEEQMTCPCDAGYPSLGQGAPAHELAHFFFGHVMKKMPSEHLRIPEFVDNEFRTYEYNSSKTLIGNFMFNSYWQDKNRGSTGIRLNDKGNPRIHHYFIYTGMESFINRRAGSGELRKQQREKLKKNNPNLFNILSEVWPCNNAYISPCKDAAYGFKLGMSQKFKIGKHDPKDPSQMICHEDIDEAELDPTEVPDIKPVPTEDYVSNSEEVNMQKKCRKSKKKLPNKEQTATLQLRLDSSDPNEHGSEFAWWLRKCCAKTENMIQQRDAANDDDMEKWIDDVVEDAW